MCLQSKIFWIIATLTVVLTIVLFFLLGGAEHSVLFYPLMVSVVVGEVAVLGAGGGFLGKSGGFNVSSAAVSWTVVLYGFALWLWAAGFGFLGGQTEDPFTWFVGGCLALTLLFGVLIGVTAIGAKTQQEHFQEFESQAAVLKDLRPMALSLPRCLATVLSGLSTDVKTNERARLLLDKYSQTAARFPILKLNNNPQAFDAISEQNQSLMEQIKALTNQSSLDELMRSTEKAIALLESYKN